MKNNENKSIFSQHNCYLEAPEDPELVKYLYDKELERSKLAINWKNFFSKDEVFCLLESSKSPLYLQLANLTGKYEVNCSTIRKYNAETPTKILIGLIIAIVAAAILTICSFGFTTKINTSDDRFLTSFTRQLLAKIRCNPKFR